MYSMISPSPALEKGQASGHPTFSLRRTSAPTYTLLCRVAIFVALLVALFILLFRGSTADAGFIVRLAAYKLIQGINPLEAAFLDATRSRQHKATLRPSITYELHSLESTGVFADWYGNPAEVGLSPFDYVVPPEWQGRLVGRNKWSVASHTECASSPDVEICDLASALRSSAYRIVDLFKPGYRISWTTDAVLHLAAEMPADVPPTRKSSIDIRILDGCIGKNCTASVSMASGDITLARHAFELVDFFEYGKLKQVHGNFPIQLFGHLSYAADPKRYYPLQNWEDKSIDYLDVDGVLGGSDERLTVTPEEYRQAKLCLFDSTPKKRMSREWVKAMLSGCVIVSDMPTESEEILAEAIIVRDVSATAMDTIQIVEDALKDPMSLQKKALRAFAYARRYHTPAYQAGYILQLSELHRGGERGYDFPLPFAAVCRVYPDGTKPVWC